jgi:hypothetical protein
MTHTSAQLLAPVLLLTLLPRAVAGQPANDLCENAAPIGDGIFAGDLRQATRDGDTACPEPATAPEVWYRYTAAVTGTVSVQALDSDVQAILSVHDPLIDGCPGALSDEIACSNHAFVGFPATAGHEYLLRVSGYDPLDTYLFAIGPAVSNDACANAPPIGEGVFTGDTTAATADGSPGNWPDIWFRYTAGFSGRVSIDTLGSSIDTSHAIYDPDLNGCPGDNSDLLALAEDCGGAPQSCNSLAVTAGEQYLVRVGGLGAAGPVRLQIQAAGALTGTVTQAATGLPFSEPGAVEIRVYNEFDPGYFNPPAVGSALNDSNGQFTVSGLRPGSYTAVGEAAGFVGEVYANLSGGDVDPSDGTAIPVLAGSTTPGVDFSLDTGGRVAGRVVDAATGLPILATVELFGSNEGMAAYGSTDESGNYITTIGQLGTGLYRARASAVGYRTEYFDDVPCPLDACNPASGWPIAVTAGATTPGVDFRLEPATGSIAGVLTYNGAVEPLLDQHWVELFDGQGSYLGRTLSYFQCAPPSCNPSWTRFRFDGLDAGVYRVRTNLGLGWILDELFDNRPCAGGQCAPASGHPVAVRPGLETPGIDFDLSSGGKISGSVLAADTGLPVPAVLGIEVFDATGTYLQTVTADSEDGSYLVEGLATGAYFLRTVDPNHLAPYLAEVYLNLPCLPGVCNPLSGSPVAVLSGAVTSGIDFVLDRGDYGGITGHVRRTSDGAGIAGALVEIFRSTGEPVSSILTTATGKFHSLAHQLLPGTYFLRTHALPYQPGYRDELYDDLPCLGGTCSPLAGTPIVVAPNLETSGIEIALDEICPAPLALLPSSLPDAAAGVPYSATFTSPGANGSSHFALGTGSLPPGLSLSGNGELSGSPVAAGAFDFSITVTDTAGCSGTRTYRVNVPCSMSILPSVLARGVDTRPYLEPLFAVGGQAPYGYALTAGSLPNGVALSPTGWLDGTPATGGSTVIFGFEVTAEDDTGCSVPQSYSLLVVPTRIFEGRFENGSFLGWSNVVP